MVIENYMDPGALTYLPDHVRTDLMKCAASNGRISLEYLVAIYRCGVAHGTFDALAGGHPVMTPTREQLIEDIAGKLWRDLCEGEGQHSEALDKSLIRKHMDRLAACLAAPPPEPQASGGHYIVGRVDHGDDEVTAACGVTLSTWGSPCKQGIYTFDVDAVSCAACLSVVRPKPEPQAMPPIEVGDWLNLATEYRTDAMRIRSGYGRVSSDIEADAFNRRGRWHVPLADQQPPDILEIRKANGTVWTREPRR